MIEEPVEKSAPDTQDMACGQDPNLSNGQDEEVTGKITAETCETGDISASFISLDDETLFGDSESVQVSEEETLFVPEEDIQEDWEALQKPLWENLELIKIAQTALAKDFAAKLKYDATKQGQIDKLYQENQKYRDDVIEKFKLQLILAVIEQIDDAEKQISHFTKQEETEKNYSKLLGCFGDVTVSFQDMLLERFDVSSWQCEPGSPFDPKRQRALKTLDTSDALRNKTVAATLRPGYEKHDGQDGTDRTVVRPEMVEVYRYNPALQQDLSE